MTLYLALIHDALSLSAPPAPCVPTLVKATVDCGSGITVVVWDSAFGATHYMVYAVGSLGHNANCSARDTTCDFRSLACGQDYSITVVAYVDGSDCVSLPSEPIIATTGNEANPGFCPMDISLKLNCCQMCTVMSR